MHDRVDNSGKLLIYFHIVGSNPTACRKEEKKDGKSKFNLLKFFGDIGLNRDNLK